MIAEYYIIWRIKPQKIMVKRTIQENIEKFLFKGKVIMLTGARQVGKTTLVKAIGKKFENETLYLNCDEPDIRELLTDATSTELKRLAGKNKLIIIDEAQRIKNIGITLKLFVDQLPGIQAIATGSSALEISNQLNEPLTGRKYEFNLFPFSLAELSEEYGWLEVNRMLEERIIFGMYPEVILNPADKEINITNLTNSYLFKDVFNFKTIRKPDVLEKLVTALAFQIGNQVSYSELAVKLGVDNETIANYIDLLEKSYVVYRLPSFSRNLRTELTKSKKIYFYDTGIRNAVISNFKPLNLREDAGALWENFLISERIKYNVNLNRNVKPYFWRTLLQQEIDYIEESNEELRAFEIKYNPKKKKKYPATFLNSYPNSITETITMENYHKFVGIH